MRSRTLTDHQREQREPLLPSQRPSRGRPYRSHRDSIDGILWRYRTGCPWRDLPDEFQPWITVYARLRRWQQDGLWERGLQQLQRQVASEGGVDWELHLIDATTIRAHQHAAGGKKRGDHALGRSRGGFGTKFHVRTDQTGKPITWTLTAGQAGERSQVQPLLDQGQIGRRRKPNRVVGDKGYTGRPVRQLLRRRGIGAVIPRFSTEGKQGVRFEKEAYKARNTVERTINRLKQYRGIATRYDKKQEFFLAGITIVVMVLFWL